MTGLIDMKLMFGSMFGAVRIDFDMFGCFPVELILSLELILTLS
jgi:hypothetical protein